MFSVVAASRFILFLAVFNARPALAVGAPTPSDSCWFEFARFGHFSTLSTNESRKSILSSETRGLLTPKIVTLQSRIAVDLETAATDVGTFLATTKTISDEAVKMQSELLARVAQDLRAQGYDVKTVKRPMGFMIRDGVEIEFPERNVLQIRAGNAEGEFPRELRRFEKDLAARKADPNLPKNIRKTDFPTSIDPIESLLAGSDMHFTASTNYGAGLTLAPDSLATSFEIATQNLRHEIRHSKGYFDLVTGKPTLNRAYITNASTETVEADKIYAHYFSVEEIDAYRSNVLSLQSAIRRHAELFDRVRTDAAKAGKKPTQSLIIDYKSDVLALQKRAKIYSDRMLGFATSTAEHASRTRAQLADPAMSAKKFAERVNTETPDDMYPGLREITITLGANSKTGAEFHIRIPAEIAAKGPEAIRTYVIKYCDEIEAHALLRIKEHGQRVKDLDRDAMSRLSTKP